ncbi:MAG: 3-deoxy-8-phosphooctulonate synthase [Candidatus Scalindua sp. AMX11]|nr:MAG: 3-deoxy-8-phosphooctulonate synthase [Candidatus Scalindua sp.]NOG86110.1 3-deoxy-8-phosphooctulonate synthase [Planctomycetota bacterium]RZV98877.1 MAG: 3-deoxy-8-phosphooctulonate synthase [Candidatus Scalindua sp. SCAELEC01]TDE66931.1 MAG: 3-deoxy-8-phosphooctulonate synthase [Candidatus Scalindua sp. AMX11]GJQ57738.1 MAG: 2-dehydro-3-deoxyphosphooctonate aldolase [Candidatus Scalindua sp.]
MKEITINNFIVGKQNPLVLMAGPCVIETEDSCCRIAEKIMKIADKINIPFVFKASFDKANRTSIKSFRGPGIEKGIKILSKIKKQFGLPLISDIHCCNDIDIAKETLDILQIPALLCRQTDLLIYAAETEKPINIKKGQFLAPWDIKHIAEKILSTGNDKIIFTERGTTFGYNNLVTDMRSIVIMSKMGFPVFYDASHSIQLPGGEGSRSGGQTEMILPLTLAAVAAGCDGIFLETHEKPENALSDSASTLPLDLLLPLIKKAKRIRGALRAG